MGFSPGQDWYYEYVAEGEKYNRHVTMYRVISDHFLKNEFDSANDEIHHIRKKALYKPNEGERMQQSREPATAAPGDPQRADVLCK